MDCRVIPIAFAVGFFGDLAVQLLPHGQGLQRYFRLHGRFEAMLIAGGALACVFSLYYLTGLEFTWLAVIGLGVLMDVVARLGLIPTLKPFYQSTGIWVSIITAGIIPILLVWLAQAIIL
jgi:predicted signal transduction protein with EAL and GGDEF domain